MFGVSTNHGYIINHLLVNNTNKGGRVSKCYLHISVNGMLRDWVAGVPRTTEHRTFAPMAFGQRARPKM